MEKTVEQNDLYRIKDNAIWGAAHIIEHAIRSARNYSPADAKFVTYYADELKNLMDGQIASSGKVDLYEAPDADFEKRWKSKFMGMLKEHIEEKAAQAQKDEKLLKQQQSLLEAIIRKSGIPLHLAEPDILPAGRNKPAPAAEEKFLTDEPEPETVVEDSEPTAEEIRTSIEGMDGFLRNWLSGGKEEFESDMASQFKTDKEKNAIRNILSDQIVSFQKIDFEKLSPDLKDRALQMKKVIANHKMLGMITGWSEGKEKEE